jgi:hypothetical protein
VISNFFSSNATYFTPIIVIIYGFAILISGISLIRIMNDLISAKVILNQNLGTFFWNRESIQSHIYWKFDFRWEIFVQILKMYCILFIWGNFQNSYFSRYNPVFDLQIVVYFTLFEISIWGLHYAFHQKSYKVQLFLCMVGILISVAIIQTTGNYNNYVYNDTIRTYSSILLWIVVLDNIIGIIRLTQAFYLKIQKINTKSVLRT